MTKKDGEVIGDGGEFSPTPPRACFPPLTSSYTRTGTLVAVLRTPCLTGSLVRPIGGRLADRFGGAKVSLCTFVGMALATGVVIVASEQKSLPLFVTGFIGLFVLSGTGNGSTYKMIRRSSLPRPGWRSTLVNRDSAQ